jgi:hypothetical protein
MHECSDFTGGGVRLLPVSAITVHFNPLVLQPQAYGIMTNKVLIFLSYSELLSARVPYLRRLADTVIRIFGKDSAVIRSIRQIHG